MQQPEPTNQQTSAVFVGSQSLLIRCAERFFGQGHAVKGVVSADPEVRAWAQANRLPLFDPGRTLAQRLADEAFDYLFSVVNLTVLPPAVLELPNKLAVNFHDGPLPEYAGLNVTSWALLNREPLHGVTWHVMTERVDEGDILKTETFPVASDETALTLNAKCYEAAFRCFDTLLDELVTGRAAPQTQDLSTRHYYARDKRPAAAASLDWAASAETSVALVRALDFGPYPNPLGLAKVWLGEYALSVTQLELLPDASVMPAGTVTHIGEEKLTVATGSFDVSVGGFATLKGEPLTVAALLERYKLKEGARFRTLTDEEGSTLSRVHQACAVHEAFWVRQLRAPLPLTLPYARRRRTEGSYQKIQLDLDPELSNAQLAAAFALYLSRIGAKQAFTLHVQPSSLPRLLTGTKVAFAHRVPLQVEVQPEQSFTDFYKQFEKRFKAVEKRGTYLLDIVQRYPELKEAARYWLEATPTVAVDYADSPTSPPADLTLVFTEAGWQWRYRDDVFDTNTIARMEQQFKTLLASIDRDEPVGQLPLVSEDEVQRLKTWNATHVEYDRGATLHQLFEAQVARTPDAIALVCQGEQLTYAALNAQANRVAHLLLGGVTPGSLVGVLIERSTLMMIALLGALKAGCAYVPLDPSYPRERLSYMAEDAQVSAILTQASLETYLAVQSPMLPLDTLQDELQAQSTSNPTTPTQPSDLAYVIYTSGSTGQPKGVMVEHGNVVNFFAGMDARIDGEAGTWLAVTSISFDISVLELFWTLARGFKVVLYTGEDRRVGAVQSQHDDKQVDFSLFYFSSDEGEQAQDKYKLLLEGAKFADEHGFTAVWTPERHFHAFGGLYPNPAVTSAALATITERVQLRSGSCVLPLHHPARIAEEWAVVDNLSGGRVGVSFASGWQPDDFALLPQNFAERHRIFYEGIEQVRRLWRGESVAFPGPKGEVEVRTLPRPVQDELPFWVTAAGNPETFRKAGEIGANLLTHLLGQTAEELTDKIKLYRAARRQAGHTGPGTVTLMLHSFVAEDETFVRQQVHEPLKAYLRSSANLIKHYASAFPAFKNVSEKGQLDDAFQKVSPQDMEALLEFSFERYYATSGLFGTPESCLERIADLKTKGVNEIACLIDFGVPPDTVMAHLPYLNEVYTRANETQANAQPQHRTDDSIPDLIQQHGVTHLQGTPSLANMLYSDPSSHNALASLHCLMVGGEAFPADLAAGLSALAGSVLNMYGPTETTIWSATHKLGKVQGHVPIGTPIANTQVYILDGQLQPLPAGVPGELVIGGEGVVRGYLNRSELTEERFVPDPFSQDPGARLYRTGDLARWNDGVLEFLGRLDHQVKIRGHRIELGEIEVALSRHEAVQQAVVVAREDTLGDQRLVAYITLEPGRDAVDQKVDQELLEHLKKQLPEFMLPAAILTLDAFPLTPNKKVDRKALPAPDAQRPVTVYTPPQNGLETVIADVWKQVLNLPTVGVQDNFFDSGGHSLLVVQTLTLLRDRLDATLQMTDLFRFPTIKALAQHLSQGQGQTTGQAAAVTETALQSAGHSRAAARKAARRRTSGRNG